MFLILAKIFSFVPGILSLAENYYSKKLDTEVEKDRIKAEKVIEELKVERDNIAERRKVLQKDIEHWETRALRFILFGSVTLWVSLVFLYSALGITPDIQRVLDIPPSFQYIPYSLIAYWTLKGR